MLRRRRRRETLRRHRPAAASNAVWMISRASRPAASSMASASSREPSNSRSISARAPGTHPGIASRSRAFRRRDLLRRLRRDTERPRLGAGSPKCPAVVLGVPDLDDRRRHARADRGTPGRSISLLGWALGSVIEGLASVIVIWRLTGTRTLSETAEGRAQKAVAVSFFLLAPYMAIEAIRDLAGAHLPQTSGLGIVVTAASLVIMPGLGIVKKRLGARLGSGATAGEGAQNLLCAGQAAAVLIGLAATAVLSWVDPAIALLLATWAVREGIGAWRSKDCC